MIDQNNELVNDFESSTHDYLMELRFVLENINNFDSESAGKIKILVRCIKNLIKYFDKETG